jgi:hypothetical protein
LLGLIGSPLLAVMAIAVTFSFPMIMLGTIPAWFFGPYVYAFATGRGGPRRKARAIGIALGHTTWVVVIALSLTWFAHWFAANLDVGIGGG